LTLKVFLTIWPLKKGGAKKPPPISKRVKRPKFKTTKKTIFKKPILKKLILDMLFCGIFVAEASGLHPPPLLGWGGGGELIILRRVAPGVV
jgi:hypothetical protein